MTIWDVMRISRRLWVVVVAGLVVTAWATVTIRDHSGAYGGHARVTFLAPQSIRGNAFATSTDSLVALAGVVAHMTGGTGGDAQSVSDKVTLLGEGVRDGYSIRQPNAGGQWVYHFEDATLDVQSAGPTLEESQQQMNAALDSIDEMLEKLQDQAGISVDQRVITTLGRGDPAFAYDRGSPMRAILATALLGLILSFTMPVLADRIIRYRLGRERRSETMASGQSGRSALF